MNAEMSILHGRDLTRKSRPYHRLSYRWFRERSSKTKEVEEVGLGRTKLIPEIMRETFSRLFSGDKLEKLDSIKPEHLVAAKFQGCLDEIPEFKRLAERCKGDSYNSGLATTGLTQQIIPQIPVESVDSEHFSRLVEMLKEDAMEQGVNPESLPGYEAARNGLEEASSEANKNSGYIDPSNLRNSIRQAIKQAKQKIEKQDQQARSLGWGTESGCTPTESQQAEKAEIAKQLQSNRKLADILEIAGRMISIMKRAQKTKTKKAQTEVTSIDIGAEVSRLLPAELALFACPEMAPVFQRKYLERALLQYDLESKERQGRGPIVVCIDDSGSMSGMPECWAKGLALALLMLARKQKRSFAYGMFNTRITFEFTEKKKGNPTSPQELMKNLMFFSGGGTSFFKPLSWGFQQIKKDGSLKEADIILITDGICELTDSQLITVKDNQKKYKASILSILIGSEYGKDSLKTFSDEVYVATDLVSSGDKAAERALSI